MIMDERTEFLDATALNTGAAGTYLIGDVMDLGVQNQDIGNGEGTYLVMLVDAAVLSAGAATVQFKLVSDAQPVILADGSATEHFVTAAIPKASLVPGYRIAIVELPWANYERYLGILQVTGVAALTAGSISAFITRTPSKWAAIADGVN